MSYRWTYVRTVDSGAGLDVIERKWLNLWRVALAAADETIQGGLLAPAWLRLFEAHLSSFETAMLRWRGHLGESAEMRRAYSGLYGRYFARAVLTAELGTTLFVPLHTNATRIQGGTTVRRVGSGDIPDWIAWDPRAQCHVLCEAKGRLSERGGRFLHGKPDCIDAGKAQFDRVEVKDSSGRRIATRDWIAANLWSTDRIKRSPVSLLWDPPSEGKTLTPEEAEHHARAMREHRDATIAARLGNPERVVRIAIAPSDADLQSAAAEAAGDSQGGAIERPSEKPHEDDYLAAVITPLGVRPIRDDDDLQAVHTMRARADDTDEPAMIFGVARAGTPTSKIERAPWLSENGIASPDGLSLFNLRSVEIG